MTEFPHEPHGLEPQQSLADWLIVMGGTGLALLLVSLLPRLWS
jgi:hypothetical protein